MIWFNDKISIRQLQALLILNIFGTGLMAMQHVTQSSWALVMLATGLAVFCIYIITTLGAMFPKHSFYEYSSIILSKPVGFILTIGFIVRLVLHISLQLRIFAEIIKQTMLYNTPFALISICVLLVSGYAASKGYESRARLSEILVFIAVVPILIVFFIAVFNVDFTNVLPLMQGLNENIIRGSFLALSVFAGLEMTLMVYPYVSNKNNVKKGAIHAIILVGILMVAVSIITIAKFGVYNIQHQMWPIISMLDAAALPGSFMQRQGVFIMSFFIISLFAIVNAGLFFSSILIRNITKKGTHGTYIAVFMLITFLVSLIPQNIIEVYKYADTLFITFGLSYMVIIPVILLAVAKVRGLGE